MVMVVSKENGGHGNGNGNGTKWVKIWWQVKLLQILTNKISAVIGDVVFWITMATVVGYSVYFHVFFCA